MFDLRALYTGILQLYLKASSSVVTSRTFVINAFPGIHTHNQSIFARLLSSIKHSFWFLPFKWNENFYWLSFQTPHETEVPFRTWYFTEYHTLECEHLNRHGSEMRGYWVSPWEVFFSETITIEHHFRLWWFPISLIYHMDFYELWFLQ